MPNIGQVREHEQTFCSDVKSWLDALFARHSDWPFTHAKVEQFGKGNNKRSDLRIYRHGSATPVLCGEVKLPGTPEGRSPFADDLMRDAFNKADNIQAPYFFTWNVKKFVLFDRSRWNVHLIERRLQDWDLTVDANTPGDCALPEVQVHIRDHLLPSVFAFLADIVQGKVKEWGLKPDVAFLHSLESHLDWPVMGLRNHLAATAAQDSEFEARLQAWMSSEMNWTFDPKNPRDWRAALERAARTLCYVFCNRLIFYEAIRAKYPDDLRPLTMPSKGRGGHEGIYDYFRQQFQQATNVTGDYEPIFYPQVNEWASALVFADDQARQGWAGVLNNLEAYNFKEIPYDIIGGIFQKLIAPEERQKFGQYFTNEDIIDIINAFCIRRAGDVVLDPGCGSGSFLVRAYHRKAWLSQQKQGGQRNQDRVKSHEELLRETFGCDIAVFAAHLATLNMAAREIKEDDNYPCIARRNFFEVPDEREHFCFVPGLRNPKGARELLPVALPPLDAVIGNPPYVRQENIDRAQKLKRAPGESAAEFKRRLKNTKEFMWDLCRRLGDGIELSGRSDLHCYFWPAAAGLLKPDGYFGFLTSSSWLDVEYGFPLQRWVLQHFKLIAVIESLDEPWFQDARVKTAVTILQRCSDKAARDANIVRFVRFQKPVSEILGKRPHGDEATRQQAAEKLRKLILETDKQIENEQLRIVPVPQKHLWEEGVRAGQLLVPAQLAATDEDDAEEAVSEPETGMLPGHSGDYVAGKWGRFLRAPDIYFKLLKDYGRRFVRLGEIAEIRFGIKSGCDAFFMPRDVTEEILVELRGKLRWNDVPLLTSCKLSEVESGEIRIIRAGDDTLHPIEKAFLRPEIHSLMQVDRPIIRAKDTNRVVLWVHQALKDIADTYVAKYIRWGSKQVFDSKKSQPVRVPERSTCASRPVWYDLTTETMGIAFWPMAQKYRHITASNPEGLVCNHNLFCISTPSLSAKESQVLSAVLNSTLIALLKHFYGRYAGSEGTLKTEVIDTVLLEVPDPRGITDTLAGKMVEDLAKMSKREITHLVSESFLNCHTDENLRVLLSQPLEYPRELLRADRRALDDSVLEMMGEADPQKRNKLLDQIYQETAFYYRFQRTQDIQATLDRCGSGRSRLTPKDLAGSVWDSMPEGERGPKLSDWLVTQAREFMSVEIPDGQAKALGAADMYSPSAVAFKTGKASHQVNYASPEHAALVAELANLEIRGRVPIPQAASLCAKTLSGLIARLTSAKEKFAELAGSRTGTETIRDKVQDQLMHWFIHGRD